MLRVGAKHLMSVGGPETYFLGGGGYYDSITQS